MEQKYKVRKSIRQSFETAYLRTFLRWVKIENAVFIGISHFQKVRKTSEALGRKPDVSSKSFGTHNIRLSEGRNGCLSSHRDFDL